MKALPALECIRVKWDHRVERSDLADWAVYPARKVVSSVKREFTGKISRTDIMAAIEAVSGLYIGYVIVHRPRHGRYEIRATLLAYGVELLWGSARPLP